MPASPSGPSRASSLLQQRHDRFVRYTDVCPCVVFRRGRSMCSYKNNMLQLAFGVVLCLSQGIAQAAEYVDVLDLPARVSALAINSPLSGMARAGGRVIAVGQRGHIL